MSTWVVAAVAPARANHWTLLFDETFHTGLPGPCYLFKFLLIFHQIRHCLPEFASQMVAAALNSHRLAWAMWRWVRAAIGHNRWVLEDLDDLIGADSRALMKSLMKMTVDEDDSVKALTSRCKKSKRERRELRRKAK